MVLVKSSLLNTNGSFQKYLFALSITDLHIITYNLQFLPKEYEEEKEEHDKAASSVRMS